LWPPKARTHGQIRRSNATPDRRSSSRRIASHFTTDPLKTIFESERYLASNNRADYFWAPFLGVHPGNRLKEVVPLDLNNVGFGEDSGLWFMDIKPENAKNADSVRRLLIPTRLVVIGFIEYIERMRLLGAKTLLPHHDLTSKQSSARLIGQLQRPLRQVPRTAEASAPTAWSSIVFKIRSFRHFKIPEPRSRTQCKSPNSEQDAALLAEKTMKDKLGALEGAGSGTSPVAVVKARRGAGRGGGVGVNCLRLQEA